MWPEELRGTLDRGALWEQFWRSEPQEGQTLFEARITHLLCFAYFQPPLCHCGLFRTGCDPVCTDGASSQTKMCCSLSLPVPSFSDAATSVAYGSLLSTRAWATQGCLGHHPYRWGQELMDTGLALRPSCRLFSDLWSIPQKVPVRWTPKPDKL